jgi:carbamoyl-phosphate synthase small subunit
MKALLVLEDGFALEGRSVNGPCESGGEVIFNTGMTGYQELLTDPSYAGQMVCMSYPLIGNYGITEEDMESSRAHLAALLVRECCREPSNRRGRESLPAFLARLGVPVVEGLDTRALTRHIRINGAMRGVISSSVRDAAILRGRALALPEMVGQNLVARVAPAGPYRWDGERPVPLAPEDVRPGRKGGGPRLAVYDLGVKWNILRMLAGQGFETIVVPPSCTPERIEALGAKAVLFSNGPGDPETLAELIEYARLFAERCPTAGICLGHQILGKALGGAIRKMKFGHHGCNHPVKDLRTGRVEISSQNHGFCVDIAGAPDLEASHVNLNDGTLEGFVHKTRPVMALQYHPEACPGPRESGGFFARFRRMAMEAAG